ncbi:MAG: carbohydrate ABC transporter permease [Clostridiales bacterium]|jgi:putative aldouronate transport system permease protein|nr:carbohydrate ABC transporter permease [Clostridiales bacterium]
MGGAPQKRNRIKNSVGQSAFDAANACLMFVFMLATLYPMLYVIFASLSNSSELMAHTGVLLRPAGFSLAAYQNVSRNKMIPSGFRNSIFIVVVGTALNLALTTVGAYFLSRRDQALVKPVTLFILFTMFFSGGMIPNYLNIDSLGLADSLWAVIFPGAINTFYLIIMRTSFMGIPSSLEESAKLDGANHFVILARIFLPLSKAVLAVMVLYYGVDHWNAWFNAMLYIRNRDLYPLQLTLREILISNDMTQMVNMAADAERISETIKHAVIVVVTLPILCLYPFLQKYFVKGVMIGAIKG